MAFVAICFQPRFNRGLFWTQFIPADFAFNKQCFPEWQGNDEVWRSWRHVTVPVHPALPDNIPIVAATVGNNLRMQFGLGGGLALE